MKTKTQKIRFFLLLILTTSFVSCQFNKSVYKDLTTGASSVGDGIGCNDVVIEINGKTEKRNKFVFGEKIKLVFNNVDGFNNINDKIYPEISTYVVKNRKDTVISNPNLLKLSDGTNASAIQLKTNFRVALPHKDNEKYKVYVKIWDRKGEGEFNYELPFTVEESNLLDIKNNGIKYSNIYLWNNTTKEPVFDKNISSEHSFILIFDNIQGLELKNDRVFPILSLNLIDNKGNKLISNPNLLSTYEKEGINPKDLLERQLTTDITFTKGIFNNPYKLIVKLKDKSSSKEINIMGELIIK